MTIVHYSRAQFRDPLWTECGKPFVQGMRVVSTPSLVTCGTCLKTRRVRQLYRKTAR